MILTVKIRKFQEIHQDYEFKNDEKTEKSTFESSHSAMILSESLESGQTWFGFKNFSEIIQNGYQEWNAFARFSKFVCTFGSIRTIQSF